jgi:hypothetical protein
MSNCSSVRARTINARLVFASVSDRHFSTVTARPASAKVPGKQ